MPKPIAWLLAGAAIALTAGAAVATEQAAQREAYEDSRAAAKAQPRAERKAMHIHRYGGRSDHLADILQLRPDQEPALKTFLAATGKESGRGEHMVKFDRRADDRSTLQRLDEMQARMAEQQAEASRKIAAIRTFYGQLDAKQKKAFDAMPMLMMVGPSFGPMMIPNRIAVAHHMPHPPEPPAPPAPPKL
jgi:hypothetical protein